jgi:8-oxo-dGTP pyrophosphatase MutT (NUDIX family)
VADSGKWSVVQSRSVREDHWIKLREDHCRTAEGVDIAPYYVLDYPDWVHIVALDEQDRVLLVRQYRHGAGEFTVELPAGRIDPSDADILAAAARELLEETGHSAENMVPVSTNAPNPATHSNKVHTILCTGIRKTRPPLDDPRERVDHCWVPVEQAVALARTGQMSAALHVASLLLTLLVLGRLHFLPESPRPSVAPVDRLHEER